MCLGIPMKVVELDGAKAVCERQGVRRKARMDLLPEVVVGDFVMVHAGVAISKVESDEASSREEWLQRVGL